MLCNKGVEYNPLVRRREEVERGSGNLILPTTNDEEEKQGDHQHTGAKEQHNGDSASAATVLGALLRQPRQAIVPRTPPTKEQVETLKSTSGPFRKIGDNNKETVEYDFEEDVDKGVFYETIITTTTRVVTHVKIN
jgi:hypothetical protein